MRREFPRKLRAEIVFRATNSDGLVCCEGCGLVLGKKAYEIDHILCEALVMDKSAKLKASDGQLLGKACCHTGKTGDDIRRVRKADRQRDKDTGARYRQPWPKRPKSPASPQKRATTPLRKWAVWNPGGSDDAA